MYPMLRTSIGQYRRSIYIIWQFEWHGRHELLLKCGEVYIGFAFSLLEHNSRYLPPQRDYHA
jgi:hypothetical protein